MASSLDLLRGNRSLFGEDVFDSKLAFTSARATATAPVGHTVSDPSRLVGVSVSGEAVSGQHTVEIRQIAKAHQVRSGDFSSRTDG